MVSAKTLPATDSSTDLHRLVGADSTADFETDPKFIDSDPTATTSSESLYAAKSSKSDGKLQDDVDNSLRDDDEEEDDDEEDGEDEDDEDDLEDDEDDDELEDEEDAEYEDDDEDDEDDDDEDEE